MCRIVDFISLIALQIALHCFSTAVFPDFVHTFVPEEKTTEAI